MTVEIHLNSSHYKTSSPESAIMNPFANLFDSTKRLLQGQASSGASSSDLRGMAYYMVITKNPGA
jgi:hypothetical protein